MKGTYFYKLKLCFFQLQRKVELRTKNDVEVFVCFMNGVLMLEISSGAELEKNTTLSLRFDQPQRHGWSFPLVLQPRDFQVFGCQILKQIDPKPSEKNRRCSNSSKLNLLINPFLNITVPHVTSEELLNGMGNIPPASAPHEALSPRIGASCEKMVHINKYSES